MGMLLFTNDNVSFHYSKKDVEDYENNLLVNYLYSYNNFESPNTLSSSIKLIYSTNNKIEEVNNFENFMKQKLERDDAPDIINENFLKNFTDFYYSNYDEDNEFSLINENFPKNFQDPNYLNPRNEDIDINESTKNESKILEKKKSDESKTKNISKKLKGRYLSKEQIHQNIKRYFINTFLLDTLNDQLKEVGLKLKFRKIPKNVVDNVNKGKNKRLLTQNLISIFKSEDFYGEKKTRSYHHNSAVLEQLEKIDHKVYQFLNKKKYREAYEDYLNSEYCNEKIINIKNKHKNEIKYHENFEKFSKNFIKYFSQEN